MKTSYHRLPTIALLAALSVCPIRATLTNYKTAVTGESSLISYYTFDAGDAADSKSSHTGTPSGTVAYAAGVGGGTDKALLLKGTGHIDLGQVADFNFASGAGTVEAWIRADWKSTPGYNPAIFASRDGGAVDWSVHMDGGKAAAGLWNGSTYQPLSLTGVSTNWHHIAVVFAIDNGTGNGTFTLYWDGAPLGTTQQGIGSTPDAPTELGSSSVSGAEHWIGALDEVAFYSAALTADAIKAHYIAFLVGDPPVIQIPPVGGTFLTGVPLKLSVGAKGAQLSYQWLKNDVAIPGQTNSSLAFAALAAADVADYRVKVSNSAGQDTSAPVHVAVGDLPAKLVQYQAAVRAEASLISYYTFDHLDAADSKASNNGTPQGLVPFGDGIGGAAGKALILDGSGQVNLGQVDAFDFPSGNGTIEAWVRADWTNSLGYNPAIFADRDGAPVNWSIHMNDAKDAAGLWNGSSYQPQPTPGTGTSWHHLAVVFTLDSATGDSTFSLFWDGKLAGTSTQGLGTAPQAPTELGSSSVAGSEHWVGGLDEVAFYSDALSAATILAHYSALTAGTPPTITVQPAGGSFFKGSTATLTVGAQGLDLTYAWFKNGALIAGATLPTLTLTNLSASDTATYHARVSNTSGNKDSADAAVAVIVPNLSAYQAAVRAESALLSYYTFDSGDATDSKGSNNGTEQGTVTFPTGIAGGTDKALLLDGSGHIDLGPVHAFDFPSGKGTVETWIRADWTVNPGYNPAIFADRDGGPVIWSVHMNSTKDAAGLWNGSAYQPLPTPNTATSWHHLAVVFDLDTALNSPSFTLYWDGAAAGRTQQALGPATDTPTQIGSSASGPDGQERWIGAFDEVAFYSDALSADKIHAHYQALIGSTGTGPSLGLTRSGNQITLSWPVDAAGFTLQSSPTLAPGSWLAVPGVVNRSITINAGTGTQFYRLTQP